MRSLSPIFVLHTNLDMRKIIVLLIFGCFFITTSCKKEAKTKEPIRLGGNVFGTTYSISYYDVSTNFDKEINELFTKINKSLSTYIPTSDISRINKGEKGIEVDSYFREVFEKSSRIYEETDGYFDPTIGDFGECLGFWSRKIIE